MTLQMDEILDRLHRAFPGGVIYREEFHTGIVGMAVMSAIVKRARESGQSYAQWLQEAGFQWRETGFTEADMRPREHTYEGSDPVKLADHVFRAFPLVGQYDLKPEQCAAVFTHAQNTVNKFLTSGSRVSLAEEAVLTLAIVHLLKGWTSDTKNETGDTSLWHFIYLQFGFNPENSDVAEQRVYKRFCTAIRNTLEHFRRFIAPSGTMVYYTSMMAHALAPKQSIENLLNILLDFYANNLDFQYIPEDTSYKALVKGMQARWDRESSSEVQLRSDSVMSGLKTLFQTRPGYMADMCDQLVCKIDRLLRGETFQAEDRWDVLLLDWYQKKSSAERTDMQGKKRERRTEYVATSSERIYLQYVMQNECVGLKVPCIRLQEVGDSRPELIFYQGVKEIYRRSLSVTGNDLCLTTRSLFVPLKETKLDFSQPLEICGEIEYMGSTIYTSGKKLYRNYLAFDLNGSERLPRSGSIYLFADLSSDIQLGEEDGAYAIANHPGQLLRLNLSETGLIVVDGEELFADEHHAGKFRLYPSDRPVQGICSVREGRRHQIFRQPFFLTLRFPEDENTRKYQLRVDDQQMPLAEMKNQECVIEVPQERNHFYRVRIVDLLQEQAVCEYDYVILDAFDWNLEQPLYLETEHDAEVALQIAANVVKTTARRMEGSDTALVLSPFGGADYEIELPTLHCSFGSDSAFSLPDRVWWESISKDVFCRTEVPAQWRCWLMLGGKPLPVNANGEYEIGNLLRTERGHSDPLPLWLSVAGPDGMRRDQMLTQICFQPGFSAAPMEKRGDALIWAPALSFIGPEDAKFRLEIDGKIAKRYELERGAKRLCDLEGFPHGHYTYRVSLKPRGLFSREEHLLYEGTFAVGDENEFRFEGRELILQNAICWNFDQENLETIAVRPSAGILEQLEFVGFSIASGETVELPEYEATLCFDLPDGRRISFSFEEDSDTYEWINPVKVWIVSDTRLILRCATDDTVYLDMMHHSIVNKHPDLTMNRKTQQLRLKTPDYFDYKTKDVDYV